MNDFEFDCLQKKRLAQQAKYRKRGSKSKKCPMSTDHMTKKQWIERCGKIVTIKMDSPVSWASFKELSKQTQEEYLKNLMEKYHINASSLAEMFHITPITVRRHIATQGLAVSFPVGHSMNAEDRRAWELSFLEMLLNNLRMKLARKTKRHATRNRCQCAVFR